MIQLLTKETNIMKLNKTASLLTTIACLLVSAIPATPAKAQSSTDWEVGRIGYFPENAVSGGREANGQELYVCRAKMNGYLTPGKLNPAYKKCYIPYGGKEHEFSKYEVLTGNFNWVILKGSVPSNAVIGGQDAASKETLYVCRGALKVSGGNTILPGKYSPSNDVCFVPYGGKEYSTKRLAVLVGW